MLSVVSGFFVSFSDGGLDGSTFGASFLIKGLDVVCFDTVFYYTGISWDAAAGTVVGATLGLSYFGTEPTNF